MLKQRLNLKLSQKEKKSLKQKAKGLIRRFSYDHGGLKPQEKELEKFLPHLISEGFVKRAQKKEGDTLFFAL